MPHIHISCTAGLGQGGLGNHMQFVSQAVRTCTGEEPYVYCVNEVESDHVVPIQSEPSWMFLCDYSPLRWIPSLQNVIRLNHFDRAVARRFPVEPVVLHAFPGSAMKSFEVIHRAGGVTVLEAATTHVLDLCRQVNEEHQHFKMGGSPFSPVWSKRVQHEYEMTDYISVSSELQVDSFLKNGYPSDKLLFAPLGVDCERFRPDALQPSRRPRQRGETFRVIQVGQVSLLKGFQYALRALEILNDPEIELVLFGGIGWRAIRVFIDSYRRRGLTIHNLSGDPLPWLQSAHVCIHPSISDGFGLAPLEAMATGVPAIVSTQTGMKDAITDGVSGFLMPSRDSYALADRIYQLKSDDTLRLNMGQSARQAALAYDLDGCQKQYAQIMKPLWNAI